MLGAQRSGRRLAGYIFGGNSRRAAIAMTAPVAQSSQKIAMTAPVAQSPGKGGGSVIRFYLPAKWSLQTLPVPNDDEVRLVEVKLPPGSTTRRGPSRGGDATRLRCRSRCNSAKPGRTPA